MLPAGAAPGTPSAAELYYRQASLAALQGHPAYGMYPGAAAAAAAAAALSLPKPAFSMFQSPVSAAPPTTTTSATPTQLNQYYQNIQRLPLISSNRHSVSPPPPPPPPPPSDVPALAWRLKPAKAGREKPGQARLFARLSKACGSGFDF